MVIQVLKYQNTGVALLLGHVLHYGVRNIPPGTLSLITGQTALFLGSELLPNIQDACISAYLIVYAKEWLRLVLSPFYHGSDMHLYYNMLSLLYKGSWLEKKFGTPYFLYLIGVFTALTNAMYILLGLILTKIFNDDGYLRACAVGFSGVLFGMKVLTTHYSPPGTQLLLGFIPMPTKYVYWAELVLIQLMVPNASFVGHLAGILVGCAYTWGPLQHLMNAVMQPAGSSVDPPSGTTSPRQQSLENLPGRSQQQPPTARPREPSLDFFTQWATPWIFYYLAGRNYE
ncbi:hypothetical protein BsWGS_03545 [Bradybaena similaris]